MKSIFIFLLLSCSMILNSQAQDWPNLQRFQAANAVLTSSAEDEARVVLQKIA
ncbi:MAG: hypothetical protein AAFZ63_09340 [Bacteroidota bacterium]